MVKLGSPVHFLCSLPVQIHQKFPIFSPLKKSWVGYWIVRKLARCSSGFQRLPSAPMPIISKRRRRRRLRRLYCQIGTHMQLLEPPKIAAPSFLVLISNPPSGPPTTPFPALLTWFQRELENCLEIFKRQLAISHLENLCCISVYCWQLECSLFSCHLRYSFQSLYWYPRNLLSALLSDVVL